MKAKFVNESLNEFQRGKDPKKSVGIGAARLYPKSLEELYDNPDIFFKILKDATKGEYSEDNLPDAYWSQGTWHIKDRELGKKMSGAIYDNLRSHPAEERGTGEFEVEQQLSYLFRNFIAEEIAKRSGVYDIDPRRIEFKKNIEEATKASKAKAAKQKLYRKRKKLEKK